MIIGSDFDGVIADDMKARIEYVKERYSIDIKPDEIHGSKLAKKVGEQAKKEIEIEVNCSERTMSFPPIFGVAETFQRLAAHGDKIVIITGRTRAGIVWAKKYMKQHRIPFHHIWSCKEFYINPDRELKRLLKGENTNLKGKGKLAERVMPAVFVEDSDKHLAHLMPVKDKVKLFLFDHEYNRHVSLEGVERVYGWKEIYDRIQELKMVGSLQ